MSETMGNDITKRDTNMNAARRISAKRKAATLILKGLWFRHKKGEDLKKGGDLLKLKECIEYLESR